MGNKLNKISNKVNNKLNNKLIIINNNKKLNSFFKKKIKL